MKRVLHSIIIAFAITSLLGIAEGAAAVNPEAFPLHLDTIPNFAKNPTIHSTQNGNWSNPSTWSPARVPLAEDVVLIQHDVTYDSLTGNANVIGIDASAALRFKANQNTQLRVGTLLVMPNGTLEVGTAVTPIASNVTAEIIINDLPIDVTNNGIGVFDPEQFGTGILVIDSTWTMHGSAKSPTFVRLSEEPMAGTTTLKLSVPVAGWHVGDKLILPDSRHLFGIEDGKNFVGQWEELSVASLPSDGKTVTLTNPLQYDHPGARNADGNLEYLPHIGNMTRNIVIRSKNPNGTRGHVQAHHNANIDIRYATFQNLGRTLNEDLDNTTFNSDGSVAHIGTNQIARYPLHTHHLRGPAAPQANGYQFTLIGNVVDGGSAAHNFKWSLVIHDSHYGLIRENLVYNAMGAAVAFEDGTESQNVLEDNFVVRVSGTGLRADRGCGVNCGREGVGYWFHGPNNYIRNNVATNVIGKSAFTIFVKYAGSELKIPAYQGADPDHDGQFQIMNAYATPLREFANNEAYGATQRGLTYWWIGSEGAGTNGPQQDMPRSFIKDFVIWHAKVGVYGYASQRLTIDHIIIRGNQDTVKTPSWGLDFQDYLQKDLIIQNADIQGVQTGIEAPLLVEPKDTTGIGFATIKDSLIRAYYGIKVFQPWHNTNPTGLNPREIHVRNVRFKALNVNPINQNSPPYPSIKMDPKTIKSHLLVATKVFVFDYNQTPGDDFQVFAPEQDPNFILPESTFLANGNPDIIGSPVAGLTNSQNLSQYGIAYGGEITPCLDNTSHPEIRGFVCDGSSSSNPPADTVPPVMPVGFTVM